MPNDKLGGAIKRRSCRETGYRGRFLTAIPFTAGPKSDPLCSSGESPPNLTFSSGASHGRSQRLAQLPEVPALNRFREIAIVTTILVEPINLP
jgi:hypothetical protein